ncbi:MAG TPA: putative LPS assembly protein LptD, partial [Chitinophagaceae bacterium]|nr:putative LPS assembly protein LptD [Chitinophagaceae bacterium]
MIIVDTIPNSEMIEINNGGFQEEDTTILADDSLTLEDDSLFSDTLVDSLDTTGYQINMPISKDTLSGLVKYEAEDSMVLDVPTKTFHLYGKTTTKFNDIDLKAAIVDFDQSSNMLKAKFAVDSGKHVGSPIFSQKGQQPFQSDSMLYDFKSRKGKIYNTVTKQGEGFLYGDVVKRLPDNSINSHSAFFTTCDVDPPHFGFHAEKVKIIPNKVLISGPANLVVEGVPTPLFIPFAIFPLSNGQRTGILPPTYEVTQQKGLGLTIGGYYFGLGEHLDLTVRGDIYSYG